MLEGACGARPTEMRKEQRIIECLLFGCDLGWSHSPENYT